MEIVTLVVEPYPFDGAIGLEVEQKTSFGQVNRLDTAAVGVFPNYTTSYEVTVSVPPDRVIDLLVRWEIGPDSFTAWFRPTSIAFNPTVEAIARMTQAVIQKATRTFLLPGAPLGSWGEMSEFGMATVRPDYQIQELLFGLRFVNWDIDLNTLVTTDDVIRVGLQSEPVDFPADKLPDVQRAITTAVSWVASEILEGAGIA